MRAVAEIRPAPPVRYRVMLFGKPAGDWRPRRVLAYQDAIRAGLASREWETGLVYEGPGVRIATELGEEPLTPAMKRQAQALTFHRKHGSEALVRAATKLAAAEDDAAALLWGEIVEELKTIRAEALAADRPKRR